MACAICGAEHKTRTQKHTWPDGSGYTEPDPIGCLRALVAENKALNKRVVELEMQPVKGRTETTKVEIR